jgi:hypothetical protein
MNQSRARVVGVATLLFLAIIAHRLLYYGARGDLVLAWLDGPAEGGAGISRQEALVLYERVGILTGWAPLVGGLLALGLRRLALPIGALFFVAAGSSFALGSPTSPVGLGVFALGHGLLLTAIYASAGVEPVGSRQARIGLFLLLSAGLNAGAVMGPSMATSISGVAGHRVWFGVFALASLGLVALGGVMTVVGRSAPGQTDTRVRERLLPIGVASLLVAWFWFLFAAGLRWLRPSTDRWSAAGIDVAWIQGASASLLIALSLLLAVLSFVASGTDRKLPSTPAMLSFALAMSALATLLQIPLSGSAAPHVLLLLAQTLLSVLGELALVIVLAAVASGFRFGIGALVVGGYLSVTLNPHLQSYADSIGALMTTPWVVGAATVSLLLGAAVWFARDRLVKIEPAAFVAKS